MSCSGDARRELKNSLIAATFSSPLIRPYFFLLADVREWRKPSAGKDVEPHALSRRWPHSAVGGAFQFLLRPASEKTGHPRYGRFFRQRRGDATLLLQRLLQAWLQKHAAQAHDLRLRDAVCVGWTHSLRIAKTGWPLFFLAGLFHSLCAFISHGDRSKWKAVVGYSRISKTARLRSLVAAALTRVRSA